MLILGITLQHKHKQKIKKFLKAYEYETIY